MILDLVVDSGDCNVLNSLSESPLHFAAEGGHASTVDKLLFQGCSPNRLSEPNEDTPLHRAAKKGNKIELSEYFCAEEINQSNFRRCGHR